MTILAVTLLTSLAREDLAAQGFALAPIDYVRRVAEVAWRAGVRGFVTSAHEASTLRAMFGTDATLVTPGIRPAKTCEGDQKRIATPAFALSSGADILVIGRPIRDAADPLEAAQSILSEMNDALVQR